jgi:hypothetical protein
MNHTGGPTYDSCDYQIGEAARRIRTWNGKPFMLWHQGGGTTWPITDAQKIELLVKHGVYPHWDQPGRGLGARDGGNTNRSAATLRGYVDNCLAGGDWHWTLFHGIGGDWVIQDKQAFLDMLDYLKSKEDRLWLPTCTNAHKYMFERLNSRLTTVSVSDQQIVLSLEFAALQCDPADESYLSPEIYDMPLTLVTAVPAGWSHCQVVQDTVVAVYAVEQGSVMYEARPGMGAIALTASDGTSIAGRSARTPPRLANAASGVRVVAMGSVPCIQVSGEQWHTVHVVDGKGAHVARFDGNGNAVYQLGRLRLAAGAYLVKTVSANGTVGIPLLLGGAFTPTVR